MRTKGTPLQFSRSSSVQAKSGSAGSFLIADNSLQAIPNRIIKADYHRQVSGIRKKMSSIPASIGVLMTAMFAGIESSMHHAEIRCARDRLLFHARAHGTQRLTSSCCSNRTRRMQQESKF